MDPRIDGVLDYWREVVADGRWMRKDPALDEDFRERFLDLHMATAARRCDDWIETPGGALALMVLLDQFPRNAFRGTAHMYATDGLARMYAREAERLGHMMRVAEPMRVFFVFPFTHSENRPDQARSLALSARLGQARVERVRGTTTSSCASGASRTATGFWAARTPLRKPRSSPTAGLPADGGRHLAIAERRGCGGKHRRTQPQPARVADSRLVRAAAGLGHEPRA